MTELTDKTRIIQEFVPGKQVTLAHVIANPDPHLYPKIGLPAGSSKTIGVLTITPGETAVIAADIATKSAGVELAFVDRFSGSLKNRLDTKQPVRTGQERSLLPSADSA